MKQSEIKELSNEALVVAFYWNAVKITNEENSPRGSTQKTQNAERWLIEEMVKRFGLDGKAVTEGIHMP